MGKNKNVAAEQQQYKKRSMWAEVWRNYRKSPSAMIGLAIVIVLVIIAIVSQFVYSWDMDIVRQDPDNAFLRPSAEHPFGTDNYGRDQFTRVMYGARYSLSVGIVATTISCILGSFLGMVAGYYGGLAETLIMRTCDVFVGIPSILLGIAIMSAFGQSISVLMWAIGLVYVPMFARIARA
ncbi:MAG: ABC transporter permease, partial [Firmicutes bacterium]|nr:ABC transporter permease [Bacillota bacterium]